MSGLRAQVLQGVSVACVKTPSFASVAASSCVNMSASASAASLNETFTPRVTPSAHSSQEAVHQTRRDHGDLGHSTQVLQCEAASGDPWLTVDGFIMVGNCHRAKASVGAA